MAATTIDQNMNIFSALEDVSTTSTQIDDQETSHLDDQEFPSLGVQPKETKKEKKAREATAKPTKYIVASTYIDELQRRGRESYQARAQDDGRGKAFAQMQDKVALAKTLTCTKPCQYVLKKVDEETGVEADENGVCYRETCTFAHSMAELQLPPCAFGEKCNRRNGSKDFNTGQINKTRKCQFCHPGETADQFYTRTCRHKPDLPATSEKSRQPKAASKKTKPHAKPTQTEIERKEVIAEPRPQLKRANAMGSEQMSALLGKTKEEAEHKPAAVETTVIRVPKELAQQAMEMAISRGLADFRIELL